MSKILLKPLFEKKEDDPLSLLLKMYLEIIIMQCLF